MGGTSKSSILRQTFLGGSPIDGTPPHGSFSCAASIGHGSMNLRRASFEVRVFEIQCCSDI